MSAMKFAAVFIPALLAALSSFAGIRMPAIFSDNMVLQSGMPLKFWGWADPGASVEIALGKGRFKCLADSEGAWSVSVPPQRADANAQKVEVFEDSKLSKTIRNVLVGEVWIAGGQSNMEFKLGADGRAKESAAAADFPLVRVFVQSDRSVAVEPQRDSPKGASWKVCSPRTAPRFSAVGFYFARTLFEGLNVPVGVVETPYSGSIMACWLARDDLSGIKCYEDSLKKFDSENASYDYGAEMEKYRVKLAEYKERAEAVKAEGGDVAALKKPSAPQIARGNPMLAPCLQYNAKIAPIAGFAARGVAWYQGESDVKINPEDFARKFERLIVSWRKYWGIPDLAFCFVQLPSIDRDGWDIVRLRQAEVALGTPRTAMAVTVDMGDRKNVHPVNKLDVGVRLGRQALLKFYGHKGIADFPSLKSAKFGEDSVRLEFAAPNSSLRIEGEPRGFEVMAGGEWVKPDIKRRGGILALSAPGRRIDAVRYLFKGWAAPDACVFNADGLPLAPFEISRK